MAAPRNHLEFIVIRTPNDTNQDAVRRQVRSHVTRVQHQRSRLSAITGVDSTKGELHSDRHRVRRRRTDGQARFTAKRVGQASDAPKKSAPITKNALPVAARARARATGDQVVREAGILDTIEVKGSEVGARAAGTGFQSPTEGTIHMNTGLPSSPLAVMFSQGAMSARTFLFRDEDNVVGMVLKHLRLDLSSVLATYKAIVKMQSQDFERNQPDMPAMKPGSTWQRFWDYIWTDPAIMIGAVLLTVTFRLQMWDKPQEHPDWYHLLQLRGFLIRTIDAAFLDPVRCICDQMLVAVALASAFEVKYYQNKDQGYHTHMKGLVKMVAMRGGLSEIQRSDPFVDRFLLWHVANTSALPRGQNVYYQQLSETSVVMHPRADTHMFQMRDLIPKVP